MPGDCCGNQYFGVATTANRIKWRITAVLFAAGAVCLVFLIAAIPRVSDVQSACIRRLERENSRGPTGMPLTPVEQAQICSADDDVQRETIRAGMLEIAFLVLWIGASIPVYMMCCCTKKPNAPGQGEHLGMPVAAMGTEMCAPVKGGLPVGKFENDSLLGTPL